MRVIFLNSWFGKAGKPFFDFIKRESSKTDIFCFMEVTPELYSNLSSLLKEFNGLYKKGLVLKMEGILCGQAIFLANRIEAGKNGKVSIYRQSNRDIGFMQFAELKIGKKKIWLGSIHGKTLPGDKFDTSVRLRQSEKIIDFFAGKKAPKIFGGDFNLNPDTKSVKMFEEAGYRNLIRDYKIDNTRNKISWKQFNNVQHFADYVFVSPDIKINKFEVPYMEVSDHLPLILEFQI